jgi:hypothetical protein
MSGVALEFRASFSNKIACRFGDRRESSIVNRDTGLDRLLRNQRQRAADGRKQLRDQNYLSMLKNLSGLGIGLPMKIATDAFLGMLF